MTRTYNIAVVGASSLVGEAILDLLAKRKFPSAKVYALDAETDGEQDIDFGNRSLDINLLAEFDFSLADIVFFAADESTTALYVPKALAAGCTVIDDSATYRFDENVPLVIPEVNATVLANCSAKLIASPGSNTTQLLVALNAIHAAVRITQLNIVTYQAVSGSGRAGVEELAKQTAQLLNARAIEPKVYTAQIAFNLIPQIDELQDNGYTKEEMKLVWEVQKILDSKTVQVNATTVRVPVFFGHSHVVQVETATKITAVQAKQLLQQTPGLIVRDEFPPTPVTDAVESEAIYVGRLREDISRPQGLNLWIVADNVRRGAALNCVQIAETLIRSNAA
ncbi:MAG: aspartate-semialdehyde dehydrogenase [Candidatus Thiocaldithrix dubininis]|uniref:Aspartate-semialdehyde dehydrogenase n=1 Tax=Candidatus Thiocaldithrix dubininis TaxID=3080823 RepID=A0AA95H6J8_9GAMM|nr:MAG: aspartate-semialdehyde dehydrogenase [Candidatus Thiocaldithrix dubininis]